MTEPQQAFASAIALESTRVIAAYSEQTQQASAGDSSRQRAAFASARQLGDNGVPPADRAAQPRQPPDALASLR